MNFEFQITRQCVLFILSIKSIQTDINIFNMLKAPKHLILKETKWGRKFVTWRGLRWSWSQSCWWAKTKIKINQLIQLLNTRSYINYSQLVSSIFRSQSVLHKSKLSTMSSESTESPNNTQKQKQYSSNLGYLTISEHQTPQINHPFSTNKF